MREVLNCQSGVGASSITPKFGVTRLQAAQRETLNLLTHRNKTDGEYRARGSVTKSVKTQNF